MTVKCRFFYEDYFRGREVEECRLPQSSGSLPWKRKVCDSCPVPALLLQTRCQYLALEGTIKKKFLVGERMEVFAVCTRHMKQLTDPHLCPDCEAERQG